MKSNVCFAAAPAPLTTSNRVLPHTGLQVICSRSPSTKSVFSPPCRARLTMGLFGLGFPELAVIAAVGAFIFGPGKIAELGKDLGGMAGGVKKATSEFRDAMQESLEEADKEMDAKLSDRQVAGNQTVDTSASAVEKTTEKTSEKSDA